MKSTEEFPFEKSRRISSKEVQSARKAIEKITRKKRPLRGRPPKLAHQKYRSISMRLHPDVLSWAHSEAKKRGIGYQTVINQILLEKIS